MKTLYLDCQMGAAGDMLAAALLELCPDKEEMLRRLNALGLPGVRYQAEKSVKCGILGTHLSVTVDGEEEGEHHHDHHEHHHAHHGLHDIRHIVSHLEIPEAVRENVIAVYDCIAQAESQVHGVAVEQIHFHEMGAMDAVADVTAVCLLMHTLGNPKVVASPIHVGSGQVHCAHGVLPVPAPATALLLEGIPTYGGSIRGELCTPTGAALLRHFVSEFGPQPAMVVEKIGYGCGKKDFERPNCVRAMLGQSQDTQGDIWELACNLDDITGEEVGFAMERLLEAGALDVYTTAIGMKKNRPGVLLTCLCQEQQRDAMVKLLFLYTTTLGVRERPWSRRTLARTMETRDTEYGPVRVKTVSGFGVRREKAEFEDLAWIARDNGISLRQAAEAAKK